MVTPTTKEQRMSLWDSLRERFRIGRVSNRGELIKTIRERAGLKKYQKAKGRTKSILSMLKKSDFWAKSKYEDRPYFLRSRKGGWLEGEETTLKELSKRYKGKELVSEFNARVGPIKRTYSAVHTRASILRKR